MMDFELPKYHFFTAKTSCITLKKARVLGMVEKTELIFLVQEEIFKSKREKSIKNIDRTTGQKINGKQNKDIIENVLII